MAAEQSSKDATTPILLDKAFFGKDNCLTVQVRGKECYMKLGKNVRDAWDWKTVKFNDAELGDIIRVLDGETDKISFFHSFGKEKTQIWVSRQEQAVIFSTNGHKKGLQPGEQKVLSIILRNAIWMTNLS